MRPSFRHIIVLVIVAVVFGILIFRVWNKSISTEIKLRLAPEFALRDYEGREVKLSDFRGKPLLVNVWASWCPFCRDELRDFAAIQKEFGDKIVIIAIDRAESLEVVKKYSDDLGVTDKLVFLLDPADSFYQSIGGFSMPETIFVNKEGLLISHKRGPMRQEEIRRRIQDVFGL